MRAVDYAQKQIQMTAQEDGIQSVDILNGRLFIQLVSGKNYELSKEELKHQAIEYLKSEIENIKQQ